MKDEFPMLNPHDGREFELLADGRKDVAFFYRDIPAEYYSFKRREGFAALEWEVQMKIFADESLRTPVAILYRVGHEAQALRLKAIFDNYPAFFDREVEREIGRILGYPNEAIEYYIMSVLVRE